MWVLSVPDGMEVNEVDDEVADKVADKVADEVVDKVADEVVDEVADGFLPHLPHTAVWCVSVPNGIEVDEVTNKVTD